MNRTIAKFLSIVFHPLFILTYIAIILLLLNPYLFGKNDVLQGWTIVLQIFFSTFIVPGIAVALMKTLGLIDSFEMEDRSDRIIPYIATATFYLWMFMTIRKNPNIPIVFVSATLGTILSLFGAFFFNNFTKISAHAVGMGGLLGIVLIAMRWFSYSYFHFHWMGERVEIGAYWLLIAVVLIAGLVCSARLWLQAHIMRDIILGFVVGIAGQWIAIKFLL